ncbi:xanthine dehydrogenase FAD-binding subunit [Escherichia coli]|uniref:Xanthine dehydrogenase FAD-binding subunit n=1 Tax=Escherichia coli TaxID=562 RepID=A0A377CW14_ECOLX|nr:xanthine dehydrogenase FAD-binding subunit [Escherichia coli]
MFDFASYHRAATLADAINLLADNPQAKLLAGGTDVLIQLHHHNDRYRHIVDIHNLAELRGITLAEDGSLTYRLCNDIYPANRRSYNSTSSPGVMCCGHVHCWTADP